jgi:phage tail-like protein
MNTPDSLWFLFRDAGDFAHRSTRLAWNPARGALMLAQNQTLWLPATDPDEALEAWRDARPLALDRFGQLARLGAAGTDIEYNAGHGWMPLRDDELDPVLASAGRFRDLAVGGDGRLAAPYGDDGDEQGVLLFHLARRWQTACPLPDAVHRAWVDEERQVWCLARRSVYMLAGQPLPAPYRPLPERFEPLEINRSPFQLRTELALPPGLAGLALCGDAGRVFVLCHDDAGNQTLVVYPRGAGAQGPPRLYALGLGVPFATDVGLLASGRLALLAPQRAGAGEFVQRDCPVVDISGDEAVLVRERHPMVSLADIRFVSSADGRLRYQAEATPDAPQASPRPRLLAPLARPRYRLDATAMLGRILDSGRPGTPWHRIYLDACIPPGCAIRVAVRVFDDTSARGATPMLMQPEPVWNPLPSELPFAQSLAGHEAGRAGLFEILVQRPAGAVRRMSGRYLQLQLTLQGNGRASPALFAIRVHAPRACWQERWLPELYRQEGAERPDDAGPANGADLRERILAVAEGMLTPLEGRIATAERWLHPGAAPPGMLGALATSLGIDLPEYWPSARQREQLRLGALVQQWHGTLAGLNLALDIASDGGVSRGEIVAVENFRLRRTMATLLGIDMDDRDHPLTLGTGMNGNSRIGPSLILSEADARTFLALFSPELATLDEAEQVREFFERYANQVSVLLHGAGVARRPVVESVLEREMPAHVVWRVIETEHPFVLGLSPLLAVDTFVEPTPSPRRVVLDDTTLGTEGLLHNPAAFSPGDIDSA